MRFLSLLVLVVVCWLFLGSSASAADVAASWGWSSGKPSVSITPAPQAPVPKAVARGRDCNTCGQCECFSNIPNGTCGDCEGVRLDTLPPTKNPELIAAQSKCGPNGCTVTKSATSSYQASYQASYATTGGILHGGHGGPIRNILANVAGRIHDRRASRGIGGGCCR